MSWVPDGAEARAVTTTAAGVEVFVVSGQDVPAYGAAVLAGSALTGANAWHTARLGVTDAEELARLACTLLDAAGTEPWTELVPGRLPEQQALAAPPTLVGSELVYWRFHEQLDELLRVTVALSGSVRERVFANELGGGDDLGATLADLEADDLTLRVAALGVLAYSEDAEACVAVARAVRDQAHPTVRAAAVKLIERCHDEPVAVLAWALAQDESAEVRMAAARALSHFPEEGRQALEAAAQGDPDAAVQGIARAALGGTRY